MKRNFKERILDALIRNGVEYEIAWYLVHYQEVEALKLLNNIKKQKN